MLLGIEPEGPAAVGGLIMGDVLVAADAQSLAQPEALAELLGTDARRARLSNSRCCARAWSQELDVRIGERPSRRR